jgi:hypothetical protein
MVKLASIFDYIRVDFKIPKHPYAEFVGFNTFSFTLLISLGIWESFVAVPRRLHPLGVHGLGSDEA